MFKKNSKKEKNKKTNRFTLLLLEENEHYFSDYSAVMFVQQKDLKEMIQR